MDNRSINVIGINLKKIPLNIHCLFHYYEHYNILVYNIIIFLHEDGSMSSYCNVIVITDCLKYISRTLLVVRVYCRTLITICRRRRSTILCRVLDDNTHTYTNCLWARSTGIYVLPTYWTKGDTRSFFFILLHRYK